MQTIQIHISTPYVTLPKYCELTGLSIDFARQMVNQGRLPIRKKERPNEKIFINMLELAREAASK